MVAIVNATLASRLWPALGLGRGRPAGSHRLEQRRLLEVVGVVANVRSRRPDAPPDPELYAAFAQVPAPAMSYVVRVDRRSGGTDAGRSGRRSAQMTPHVALAAVRTFDEVVTTSTRMSGLLSWLSVLFGALAAALAILGIYSVMSYTVAQRERELAIRSAVGASRSTLLSLVLTGRPAVERRRHRRRRRDRVRRVRRARTLLYDVSATDPSVFLASAVGLAVVALARLPHPRDARGARVEPVMAALRSESNPNPQSPIDPDP